MLRNWVVRRIALVGNSHVLTLFEGYPLISGQLPADLELTFVAQGQHKIGYARATSGQITQEFPRRTLVELVCELEAPDVFAMWLGSQINIRALLLEGPRFDAVLPTDGVRFIDPDVQVIPCSAIESFVRRTLDEAVELLEIVDTSRRRGARVWLLAPPHPLPEAAVRERLGKESHFATRLTDIGVSAVDVGIVPGAVRVRLRKLLLKAYADFAADHCAGFCPPPDHVADAEGMLTPGYWGKDITHGSAAYGAAYLQELVANARG